jgi:hypothetical protein
MRRYSGLATRDWEEDSDQCRIFRALERIGTLCHPDWTYLNRFEIKAELIERNVYLRVSPFWRIQIDRFLELLPEAWLEGRLTRGIMHLTYQT